MWSINTFLLRYFPCIRPNIHFQCQWDNPEIHVYWYIWARYTHHNWGKCTCLCFVQVFQTFQTLWYSYIKGLYKYVIFWLISYAGSQNVVDDWKRYASTTIPKTHCRMDFLHELNKFILYVIDIFWKIEITCLKLHLHLAGAHELYYMANGWLCNTNP